MMSHRLAGQGAVEAGPTSAGVKFGFALKQGRATTGAVIYTLAGLFQKFAGVSVLRASFPQDFILLIGESLSPLILAQFSPLGLGRGRPGPIGEAAQGTEDYEIEEPAHTLFFWLLCTRPLGKVSPPSGNKPANMENRRAFSRQASQDMVLFRSDAGECLGELRNVSLGGLRARVPKELFEEGEHIWVGPQGGEALEYLVCWREQAGAGLELGLRYPHSIATFWQSWAADLLAEGRITNGEVLERRSQVRMGCALKGAVKHRRKQHSAMVLDIGGGGALVESDAHLEEGAHLQLTVKNPVRVGHLPCRVARVWEGPNPKYGLCFEDLKERHRLALVRLLDLLIRQGVSV